MLQRVLTIVIIVAVVLGGGFYAYRELVPPPEQEAQGPIYSTKTAIVGDISSGVNVTGPLNPARSGSIQSPGGRVYYDMPSSGSNVQYTLLEILVPEGEPVSQGQVIATLAAPELEGQLKTARDELKSERRFLSDLTGLPENEVGTVNPAQGVTLTAPIDGRISGLSIREGKKVEQGEIVAKVVDDSKFKISAKLYTHEFSQVKVGDRVALSFSFFDGNYFGTITDANPNPVPDGDEDNPVKGFVHWVTIEADNPGLVKEGLEVSVGRPLSDTDATLVQWFANKSLVESFVDEERIISTVDALATKVHVKEMQSVKKGDTIVSLAGADVQKTIQDKLEKIREKEAQLIELSTKASQLEVKAPMDGIIANWDAQPGATLNPGEWMGYVYNTSDMGMWVEVDDVDVLHVKTGSPVKVTVEALPGESYEGEVTYVSTMGSDSRGITRFSVDIRVKGGPNLRPGMQANAFIDGGSATGVIIIPLEGIFEEDGTQKVEVLNEDGSTKVVSVKLGLMNDRWAEVKEGLEEGDLVITGSSADLLPSQHIGSKDSILPTTDNSKDDSSKESKE